MNLETKTWDRLIKNRKIALATCKDLPKYLLYPEIIQFLDACKNDDFYLFYTMWVTGARVNEVLQLTPSSFCFEADNPHVMLPNLKASKNQTSFRYIPLTEKHYISEMERYLYLKKKGSDGKKLTPKAKIWPVTDRGVNKKIKRIAASLNKEAFEGISTKTFRHSCAINHLLHGVAPKVIGALLGHSSSESTEVYLNILVPEIGHLLQDSQFSARPNNLIEMETKKIQD